VVSLSNHEHASYPSVTRIVIDTANVARMLVIRVPQPDGVDLIASTSICRFVKRCCEEFFELPVHREREHPQALIAVVAPAKFNARSY
jgi:hypothetical protein